jgi:hypothetical protein
MLAAKCATPAIVMDLLETVWKRSDRNVQLKRASETSRLRIADLKGFTAEVSTVKDDLNSLKEAVQLALRYDVAEFNDKKRERYVKIIGNALCREKQIDDLASYIQDVEQLGERDMTALKVLNKVMNKPGNFNVNLDSNIHPGLFVQRRRELAVQMAHAFGMTTDGNTFSREEGYDACNRLQAFGLAHEIETSPRQVPTGDYPCRPSLRGLTPLKLIGEEVPNWDKYNPPQKTKQAGGAPGVRSGDVEGWVTHSPALLNP